MVVALAPCMLTRGASSILEVFGSELSGSWFPPHLALIAWNLRALAPWVLQVSDWLTGALLVVPDSLMHALWAAHEFPAPLCIGLVLAASLEVVVVFLGWRVRLVELRLRASFILEEFEGHLAWVALHILGGDGGDEGGDHGEFHI